MSGTTVPVDGDHCDPTTGCLTCGDVAIPLTVVEVAGNDAVCVDDEGRQEQVALDLVEATVGDRVLVHARVAIERIEANP